MTSKASTDVLAERKRQIEAEGWTPEHDDAQSDGQLLHAAISYARYAGIPMVFPPMIWPFEEEWWKQKDRRRDLVRAAALIIAEIERMDRSQDCK